MAPFQPGNIGTLREILSYHILPGEETVSDLAVNGKLWPTLDNQLQVCW